jgi:hypothetical protein
MNMQKEMRSQIERIKTELTFKQNEQDSIRASLAFNRNRKVLDSPRKEKRQSQQPSQASGSPLSTQAIRRVVQPSKNNALPGFVNAFGTPDGVAGSGSVEHKLPSKRTDFRRNPSQAISELPSQPSLSTYAQERTHFMTADESVQMADDQFAMVEDFDHMELDDELESGDEVEDPLSRFFDPVSEV